MKAIVFESNVNRIYFLGYYNYNFIGFLPEKLEVDSNEIGLGSVLHEDKFVSWEEIFKTDEYTREFSTGEFLNVNGDNYVIVEVSHAEDGTIFYRIDKKNIVEDEESKIKAESDLESRKKILEERVKEEENKKWWDEEEKRIRNVGKSIDKKWYEFWK